MHFLSNSTIQEKKSFCKSSQETSDDQERKSKAWKRKTQFKHSKKYMPPANILGNLDFDDAICSYTEFDPLELVVIGNIDDTARMHQSFIQYDHQVFPMSEDKIPHDVILTIQKQQQQIVQELQERGIKVIRTGYVDHSVQFESNGIKTTGFNNFNPRDLIFAYDDSLYEFPCHLHCRKRQIRGFEWFEEKLYQKGSKIFEAPEVDLDYVLYAREQNWQAYKSQIIYGDSANLIKLGLDILFQISSSGSWGCYHAFRQMIENRYNKRVRVHPIANVQDGVHVDTTFTVIGFNKKIQKYIVVVNGRDVSPANMPAIFRGSNWRVIDVYDIDEQEMEYKAESLCSEMIAINMLPITSDLILMSDKQVKIQKTLQYYGIQTLKMPHTYARLVLGGYHCMSNDLKRRDTHGFGQILRKQDPAPQELSGLFDPALLSYLQSKGDLQKWVEICNEERIFPSYLTDHMSECQKEQMQKRHRTIIEEIKK